MARSDSEAIQTPRLLQAARPAPVWALRQVVLTVGVVALLVWLVFPRLARADGLWDALGRTSAAAITVIVCVFVLNEVLKAVPYVLLVPGMSFGQSVVVNEATSTISNTVPGPSGTAATYLMFRSWGFGADEFGKATVVNGVWNNAVIFVFPVVAVAIYAPGNRISGYGLALGAIGIAVALVGGMVAVCMARSEGFSRRVGTLSGRVVTWARGIVRRPKATDFGEAVVKFRSEVVHTVRDRWASLTVTMVVKYLAMWLLLVLCLRAVGVGTGMLGLREILVGYAAVRLATVIQVTPGGVGVTEVLYAAVLQWLAGTDSAGDTAILAGTLLFRAFSFGGPILVGIGAYVVWRTKKSWRSPDARVEETPAALVRAGLRTPGD